MILAQQRDDLREDNVGKMISLLIPTIVDPISYIALDSPARISAP